MIRRFQGRDGPRLLREALRCQKIIGREGKLADALLKKVTLLQLQPGKVLIRQGAADNAMFFILVGQLSVLVQG